MICAGMATVRERERLFRKALNSICGQVDNITVVLNNYDTVPLWLSKMRNVNCVLSDNRLGDAGKFLHIDQCNGFYVSVDDDLIYPPNYVPYMMSKYMQHVGSIITLHGKLFKRPIESSHRGITQSFHCLRPVKGDHIVDTGGTGVMLLNTNDIKISINDFIVPNMADIWLSKLAKEQGVNIVVVEHNHGWLKYLNPVKTIWGAHDREKDAYQAKVLSSFLESV